MDNGGERTPQAASRGSLTPTQQRTRERFEQVIGVAAPFLDLVLAVGERISRAAEPEDYEYYPVRGEQLTPEERRAEWVRASVSTKEAILEREQRAARPVAIVTLVGCALFLLSSFGEPLAGISTGGRDAQQLHDFHDHATAVAVFAVISAIAVLMMTPVLVYLFEAARARNPRMRRELIGLIFIGFVLLAVSIILGWLARQDLADTFIQGVHGHKFPDHYASGLLDDSGLGKAAATMVLPAILALVISLIYTALQAMRAGLLTRFFGTLGMALGAAFLVIGPLATLFVALWLAYVAMLIGDWLPRGRPPSWEAGEAIPWLKPGEEASPGPANDPAAPGSAAEEAAAGGAIVEGEATPVPDQSGERRKRKRRQ